MKHIPSYLYVILVGVFLIALIVTYNMFDFKQNEKTASLNEIVATQITAQIDLGDVRVHNKIFIDKPAFEAAVSNELNNKYNITNVFFNYLEDQTGALKALKVRMIVEDEEYMTTYKVNEI